MRKQPLTLWFRIVSVILILFGTLYVVVGLKILPVQRNVLVDWESALYGALMIGWGTTLLLIGRLAFQRDDQELKRALLIGLLVWLTIEAAASVWFGVWFNVGVDAGYSCYFWSHFSDTKQRALQTRIECPERGQEKEERNESSAVCAGGSYCDQRTACGSQRRYSACETPDAPSHRCSCLCGLCPWQ